MACMSDIRNIVILTGAGISAESGIDTFRDAGGLWEQHRVEDVATPEGFARDPDLVLGFYDMRREALSKVQPNAAHDALARLDSAWSGELLIVTQNVDDRAVSFVRDAQPVVCANVRPSGMPGLPSALAAARCRVVRRNALPDGTDLRFDPGC